MEKFHFALWSAGAIGSTVLIYFIVGRFFLLKKGWLRRSFLFVCCCLLGSMIIYFGDWGNLPPTLVLFLLAVWLGCEGSGLKRITIGLMLASTIFAGNALWDNYYGSTFVKTYMRLAFTALLYMGTRYFAPKRDFELNAVLWRLFLLLILTPIGIVLSVVLLGDYVQDDRLSLVLMGISVCSFAGLLWTVTVLFKQGKLEEEQAEAKGNRKYYEAMEQQNYEIRRLKHDLSNHLQVLYTLPEEKKEAYIEELLKNPSLAKTLKYCSDNTVNIILSNKASVMAQKEIEFYVKADIREELPMEKTEICAVLGNALDNAIEAVENRPVETRRIRLELRFAKGMLVLNIENPCDTQTAENGTLPETTKKNKALHGYGLKSIRSVAEKYGGGMNITEENNTFRLFFYCNIE